MDIPDNLFYMLRLSDLEDRFRRTRNPVLLNKFDFSKKGYADQINSVTYSKGAEVTFSASCECGYLEDNFNIGMTCPKCGTKVEDSLITSKGAMEHKAWISFPKEIPGVLHPTAYFVLSKWMKKGTTNYIDLILDPRANVPNELKGVLRGHGFKYFHDDFDYLMEFFLSFIKKGSAKENQYTVMMYREFINRYRSVMFTRYLPALNSALHPITNAENADRKYADKGSQFILEAAHTLSHLEFYPKRTRRQDDVDLACFSAYKSHVAYLNDIIEKKLKKKTSILRKHVFGARFHWSARSVIRPITGPHRYDELHVPWAIAVNLLRVHIVGRLIRHHGMLANEAWNRQQNALIKEDPLIRSMIEDFIEECPYPGLPLFIQRNPSIRRGAAQIMYMTKVHKNIHDKTIGMSSLTIAAPNADKQIVHPYRNVCE